MDESPNNQLKGFSLIELLVVISIFSILAVVVTQVITTSLRSSTKSRSIIQVRENVNFAQSIIERKIRSARSVVCSSPQQLDFVDEDGVTESFFCDANGNFIAYNSSRLTSSDISVDCSGVVFSCFNPTVEISISASSVKASGAAGGQITSTFKVTPRSLD